MNVLVLAGGTSSEKQVSLRSGEAVSAALRASGHTTTTSDPATTNIDKALCDRYDVIFPVTHGVGGEDGSLQALLDSCQAKYVGSGELSSRLCFDKIQLKEQLQQTGILTPSWITVDKQNFLNNPFFNKPFVLKPISAGSSIDTIIQTDPTTTDWDIIKKLLVKHNTLLLEELVKGTEITVSVLDSVALPVIEIIPPDNEVFDYQNKYNGATQELCPPKSVAQSEQIKAQKIAENVHQLANCRHYSRTDMIIANNGNIFVLETNTLPGMTEQSLFPKSAAAAGITMPDLCNQLVDLALAD